MIITINNELQWDNTKPLQEQDADVQAWYGEHIQAQMAYRPNGQGIQPLYDTNGRPSKWIVQHENIEAHIEWVYLTDSTDWCIQSAIITLKTQA